MPGERATLWSQSLSATSTFDVLPQLSNSQRPPSSEAHFAENLSTAIVPQRRIRITHVTVLGSIPNGQTRVLMDAALSMDRRYFDVLFVTTLLPDWQSDTIKELSNAGVGVLHVRLTIPKGVIEKYGNSVSMLQELGRQYEQSGRIQPDLYSVVKPLVSALRGSDIMTFTHIASSVEKDKLITVAAGLAGVKHRLCDPGNLVKSQPILLGITGLLVPSFVAKEHWEQVIDRVNHQRIPIHVVQPGASRPMTSCIATQVEAKGNSITVAYIGRLDQVKNPSIFLRVAHKVFNSQIFANVQFIMIGNGPIENHLKELAQRLGLMSSGQFKFLGALKHSDILCLLSEKIDLVLHTTIFNETFGLSNIEAMRAGVPVITYGVGGQADYLRGDVSHAIVVSEPTVDAMASATVRLLLSGHDEMRKLGEAAQNFVEANGFTARDATARFASLYSSLVNSSDETTKFSESQFTASSTMDRDESAILFFQQGQDLLSYQDGNMNNHLSVNFHAALPLFDRRVHLHRGLPFLDWYTGKNMSDANAKVAAVTMLSYRCDECVPRIIQQGAKEWRASMEIDKSTGRKSIQYPKTSGLWPGSAKSRGTFYVASKSKILHDRDQFEYNVREGLLPPIFLDLVARNYTNVLDYMDGELNDYLFMDARHLELVGSTFNRLNYRYPTGRVEAGKALSSDTDFAAAEKSYMHTDNRPGFTVIDNFLSADVLSTLLKMLMSSSIWFDVKSGYLGAYHSDGLSSPLLVQIADEMREKLPNIIRDLPLRTIWAYKCMQNSPEGLALHADAAAVNVNLWITPDSANLNRDTGGLIVYLSDELPHDWSFEDMNRISRVDEIRAYLLSQQSTRKMRVPYRQNRAVIFHSRLFHETEPFQFKDGFENMRINLTFLFGFR